jgi:ribose transport system permease protein
MRGDLATTPGPSVARLVGKAGPGLPIYAATAVLFAISPIVASGSLSSGSLATMFPFAAILAIVAIGQTLVIQQGGLDFSVPGMISLSTVIVSKVAGGDDGKLVLALAVLVGVAVAVGLLNGTVITRFGVTPLIATLGVNALLLGANQQISGGLSVQPAPPGLTDLATGKVLGIYNTVAIALVVLGLCFFLVKRTVLGRRFEAVGASPAAARVAGISVPRYRIAAYVGASLTYALAGLLLAGYLRTPGIEIGDSYLLASIAAVVIGGTALGGGAGSAVASVVGALFLTQLSQLLLATGAETSINLLVQGGAIAVAMALRTAVVYWSNARRRARAKAAGAAGVEPAATSAPAAAVY